jgi:mannose-6-phosphate isomerase-like protein (cupin superfamily)
LSDHRTFDLRGTYLSIDDQGVVTPLQFTQTFWDDLIGGRLDVGRWLMGAGLTKESPPNWDMHPTGECILFLLSGSIDMIVAEPDGERVVQLRQVGDTCVVPRGIWHRQILHEPSNRIFLVAGHGTQMKPV